MQTYIPKVIHFGNTVKLTNDLIRIKTYKSPGLRVCITLRQRQQLNQTRTLIEHVWFQQWNLNSLESQTFGILTHSSGHECDIGETYQVNMGMELGSDVKMVHK